MTQYKKPILAVDSQWCVILDEKVKHVSLWMVLLKVCGYISLFGLTCFGLIGGVTSKFVHDKLVTLDQWFEQPANERLAFYYFIGSVLIFLGTTVCIWAYKKWVK